MNAVGYILLSRKLLDDPWWEPARPRTRLEAWLDILFMARHTAGTVEIDGEAVRLERGEFAASLRFLAVRWHWSVKRVRGFLQKAEGTERIRAQRRAHDGAHTTTVYLVVNYGRYQRGRSQRGTPEGTVAGTPEGTPGAQVGHKDKEGKEGKERIPVHNTVGKPTWLTPFGEAWKAHLGGTPPFGRMGRAFESLVAEHGATEVLARWVRYLDAHPGEKAQYATAENFAQRFGLYGEPSVVPCTDENGIERPHRKRSDGGWECQHASGTWEAVDYAPGVAA